MPTCQSTRSLLKELGLRTTGILLNNHPTLNLLLSPTQKGDFAMNNTITKQKIPFTQISNELLNDKNLSLKAKGLYSFMFSKPEGWNFTIKSMAAQLGMSYRGVQSVLLELKDRGYITYFKRNDGTGFYQLHTNSQNAENALCEKRIKQKTHRIINKDISSNKDINSNKDIYKEKHFSDQEVDLMFTEYLQVRKAMNLVHSYNSIQALVNKINLLAKTKEDKLHLIESAILGNWKNFNKPITSKEQSQKQQSKTNDGWIVANA